MNKYRVFVYDAVVYEDIEADSEEQAQEIALEFWNERIPTVIALGKKEWQESFFHIYTFNV